MNGLLGTACPIPAHRSLTSSFCASDADHAIGEGCRCLPSSWRYTHLTRHLWARVAARCRSLPDADFADRPAICISASSIAGPCHPPRPVTGQRIGRLVSQQLGKPAATALQALFLRRPFACAQCVARYRRAYSRQPKARYDHRPVLWTARSRLAVTPPAPLPGRIGRHNTSRSREPACYDLRRPSRL